MKLVSAIVFWLTIVLSLLLTACADDDDDSDVNISDDDLGDDDDDNDNDNDDSSPTGNDDDDDDLSPPSGWRMELVDDQGPFGDNRVRTSPSGKVHLAYSVFPLSQDAILKHAVSDGALWDRSVVRTFTQGGGYFTMELRDETPTIAYQSYLHIPDSRNQLLLADRSGETWTNEVVWEEVFDAYDLSLSVAEETRIVFCDQAIVENAVRAKIFLAVRVLDQWMVTEEFSGFSPTLHVTPDDTLQIVAFVDSATEDAPAEQRGKLVLWTESFKGWTWEIIDDLANYDLPYDSQAYFTNPFFGINESEEPSVAYSLITITPDYPDYAENYSLILAEKSAGLWETETFCTDCYLHGYQQKSSAFRRLLFTDENRFLVLADDQSGTWSEESLSLPNGYVDLAVDGNGFVHLAYSPAPNGQAHLLYYLTNKPE